MREIKQLDGDRSRHHRRIRTVLMCWAIVLAIIAIVIYVGAKVFINMGYQSLKRKALTDAPALPPEQSTEQEQVTEVTEPLPDTIWQDNWISYNGKIYTYNEDILTFLLMGIDKLGKVTENPDKVSGGQSDFMFLLIANPHDKSMKLLGINRDTMTEICMKGMGPDGEDLWTVAELTVQHGFGDGKEGSCELTRDAISKLLYDLPIHGYVSINEGAIPKINDRLGGVTVTLQEDMTDHNKKWKQGAEVTLKGNDAMYFVQNRDCSTFESARARLGRQKQYLSAMGKKALEAFRSDVTLPLKLYNDFKKYMVTDLTVDEISYLATELTGYDFNGEDVYTLPGETRMGEKFEEFYPDEAGVKDLMIQLFYEEVER